MAIPVNPLNYVEGTFDWYEHRGRIYLEERVLYGWFGDPGGEIVPTGGLPVEARPLVNTVVTIYPDTQSSDNLYGHFTTFTGVVGTDGSIRLTGDIPVPSDSGVTLQLMFGNVSWARGTPQTDTVPRESLTPWLIQDLAFYDPPGIHPTATSQGATIGGHDIRAHLGGGVTMVTPDIGNLAGFLPERYRAAKNDAIAITGSDGWWPAFVDTAGFISWLQMSSKPLLRALSQPEGEVLLSQSPSIAPWLAAEEAQITYPSGELYLNEGPDADITDGMRLQGHFSPPSEIAPIGTQFGFVLGYGTNTWYKIGAERMADGHWWSMLTAYSSEIGSPVAIPGQWVDHPSHIGQLPNGLTIIAQLKITEVQPVTGRPAEISIEINISGTVIGLPWPQGFYPEEVPFLLPSEYGQQAKWGFYKSEAGATLTNVEGDWYYPPSTVGSYPPTWLPEYGFVQSGYQFDLDDAGWRILPYDPPDEEEPGLVLNGPLVSGTLRSRGGSGSNMGG